MYIYTLYTFSTFTHSIDKMSRSRTPLLNIPIEFEPPVEDIRVVVGIGNKRR